jgi:hypothetical protein
MMMMWEPHTQQVTHSTIRQQQHGRCCKVGSASRANHGERHGRLGTACCYRELSANHQALQLRFLHNCCTVTVPANNSNMKAILGDARPYSQPTAAMQWLETGKACCQQSLRCTPTSPQPEYAHEYSRNLTAQHKRPAIPWLDGPA